MLGIHYITFCVKSLEYAWDILHNSWCKSLEYACNPKIFWKIFQIVELRMSNAYCRDFTPKFSRLWNFVRYQSLMDLQQLCPAPSSSATPFPSQSPFYFHHISNTPPFIPVLLVSPCIPMFPHFTDIHFHVTMILLSLTYSFSPCFCLSLFHASTFRS